MVNTWIDQAPVVTDVALGLLFQDLVLGACVYRDAQSSFQGQQGDTINIRRPARLTATDVGVDVDTRTVSGQALVETSIAIKLEEYPTNAVTLSDEDLTLEIDDFAGRVLAPQLRSVADYIEAAIADALQLATAGDILAVATDGSDIGDVIVDARQALNDENVSRSNRVLVVGSRLESMILKKLQDDLQAVDNGLHGMALREAVIGRLSGFTVVGSNELDKDVAVAMHPTCLAMATVAPAVPQGCAYGASRNAHGYAMRHIKDYNPVNLSDRSIVGTYLGLSEVLDVPRDGGSPAMVRAVQLSIGGS
jgi:hypothetical protein